MNYSRFILFLKICKGIGDASIRKLINDGCIEKIKFEKIEEILPWIKNHRVYFKNKKIIDELTLDDIILANKKRVSIESNLKKINCNYISCYDDNYPSRYKKMYMTNDYPILLFYKGNIDLMNSKKICSIIGTRNPSKDAQDLGFKIGTKMVEKGYVIMSGLALGCDTIGHMSCLNANGKTIAIMGTGIDIIYPKENKELAQRIVENDGLLITEELPGFSGASYSFVNRDRLQSAGADIIVALETSIGGGTMHAAKATVEKYDKELYVIDPSMLPNGDVTGNYELIENYGAKIIHDISDLICA